MTVGELSTRMSAREVAEWRAYFTLENEDRDKTAREIKAQAGAKARAEKVKRR